MLVRTIQKIRDRYIACSVKLLFPYIYLLMMLLWESCFFIKECYPFFFFSFWISYALWRLCNSWMRLVNFSADLLLCFTTCLASVQLFSVKEVVVGCIALIQIIISWLSSFVGCDICFLFSNFDGFAVILRTLLTWHYNVFRQQN